jgi:ornithine cyclodeaminase
VFVDFREAALHESGDLIGPISSGAISASSIVGDFSNLSRGANVGRTALGIPADAMTVFKAVGSAIADLAAAILAYHQLTARMEA